MAAKVALSLCLTLATVGVEQIAGDSASGSDGITVTATVQTLHYPWRALPDPAPKYALLELRWRRADLANRRAAEIKAKAAKSYISKPKPQAPLVFEGTAASNRALGQVMAAERGWVGAEWACLDTLWGVRESGWRTNAGSPDHSYGIPQSLPGRKMATVGADWVTNPRTQITWGLGYIGGRYGRPCVALDHSYASGWY